jgi:hypothetical protein
LKRLAVLGLFFAVWLPVPTHAAPSHLGCCVHRFRLNVKTSPGPLGSFALVDVYFYGTATDQRPLYIVHPFCGPAYFAHRPCAAQHSYNVYSYEGDFPPKSWTAQWAAVRNFRGFQQLSVFHSVAVSSAQTRGVPTLTAVYPPNG